MKYYFVTSSRIQWNISVFFPPTTLIWIGNINFPVALFLRKFKNNEETVEPMAIKWLTFKKKHGHLRIKMLFLHTFVKIELQTPLKCWPPLLPFLILHLFKFIIISRGKRVRVNINRVSKKHHEVEKQTR